MRIAFIVSCLMLFCYSLEVLGQVQRVDTLLDDQGEGLRGQVVDSALGMGLPFAHVFLMLESDTVKLAADAEGYFVYVGTLPDAFRFRVTMMGYRPVDTNYSHELHGSRVRVLMQPEPSALERVEVVAEKSDRRSWRYFILGFNPNWPTHVIDDQDTMFLGRFPKEISQNIIQMLCWVYPNAFPWVRTYGLEDLERFLRTARRAPDSSVTEQVRAAREELSRLQAVPDREFLDLARAKGISPRRYRREQVQALEKLIAYLELRNSQTYIDQTLAQAQERHRLLTQERENHIKNFGEAKYRFKRKIASYTVDGKLYNYGRAISSPYCGLMAVFRVDKKDKRRLHWGLINEEMEEVIPCRYGWVANVPSTIEEQRRTGWSDGRKSQSDNKVNLYFSDPRGWITVGDFDNLSLMGMVDREGKERLPLKFIRWDGRHQIIEFFTLSGSDDDFAPVTVSVNGRLLDGIIDRTGKFTLSPTFSTPIFWDKDRACFYTIEGMITRYFDAYGKER